MSHFTYKMGLMLLMKKPRRDKVAGTGSGLQPGLPSGIHIPCS